MIVFPNAKINIGLNVIEKRPDGYHNLESVFVPIPLSEILEVVEWKDGTATFQMENSGIEVDTPVQNNICIKALDLIHKQHPIPPVKVHLHKAIPFGAGLGGGSADAAFMLKLLNELFELNVSTHDLKTMASSIGADCPFFIDNQPAYVTGIGDVLKPIELNLKGYFLALVKPNIHVSTADAYGGIVPIASSSNLEEDIQMPIWEWKGRIKNDFELTVFKKYPAIKTVKEQLYELGAEYASMSGSGSTVFGLFKKKPNLDVFKDCFTFTKAL